MHKAIEIETFAASKCVCVCVFQEGTGNGKSLIQSTFPSRQKCKHIPILSPTDMLQRE